MHDAMSDLPDELEGTEALSGQLSGGMFFAIKKPTGAGALYPSVTFLYKGPIVITVFTASRSKATTHTLAMDLLQRQWDRLPQP
jgi:hypothetical protein